jgi:hypothetical protein
LQMTGSASNDAKAIAPRGCCQPEPVPDIERLRGAVRKETQRTPTVRRACGRR